MPKGDGTGPTGEGRGTGRGLKKGGGKGSMGGFGLGSGDNCVCPSCGKTASHQKGVPCMQVKCPNCGSNMTRNQ